MKISLNWMQDYSNVDLRMISEDKLIKKIGAQLGAVEGYWKTGDKYDSIVVARVVTCENHPNADKLKVCSIDDGGITPDVNRNEEGLVKVVCGASNVREGMLVAWIPPGAVVPSTFDGDKFVIEAREIRGIVSNGMLGSPKELAVSDSHDGILEIDPSEAHAESAKPGVPFKQLYGLDDLTIEIENKMFTHRPDCFGMLGVAREIAGITEQKFTSPDWYISDDIDNARSENDNLLEIRNEIPDLCPRYMACIVDGVKVGPSPLWIQSYLTRVGVRPINNIVDMTNYLMLLTGQPLHAFDFDKIAVDGRATIVVRRPKQGEKMTLLGSKTIEPRADSILICDKDKPIALGGVMGSSNSEIDENTTRIIIECATFDMYNIRKTSMEHGIFTDAVTRFTKGQSPLQCPSVLSEAVQMTAKVSSGAKQVGVLADANHSVWKPPTVEVSCAFINARLGLKLSVVEIKQILANVEFSIDIHDETLRVTAPFWRTDIEIPEDVVEEVGRLYGYDNLPLELPTRDLTPPPRNEKIELQNHIRHALSAAGANELLTYSFVHGNLLDRVGQDKDKAFQILNALSPDLQYYRMSLTPSLLEKIHPNIKAGYEQFALFELGKVHTIGDWDKDEQQVPLEKSRLAVVLSCDSKNQPTDAPYYLARNYLGLVAPDVMGMLVPYNNFDLSKDETGKQLSILYEPNRSALVVKDGIVRGVVGEIRPNVARNLKLPACTAGFEIDFEIVMGSNRPSYRRLSRYPMVTQDISLKVNAGLAFGELQGFISEAMSELKPAESVWNLRPLDIYQGEDKAVKHITFRLEIASYNRTLTDQEVNKLLDEVAVAAHQQFGAERL